MASRSNEKTYACPFCEKRFVRSDMVDHIEDLHEESLPEGFSAFRFVFHLVNKRPLTYHGICTECKGPTDWDEERGRYKRQCNKKACHDSYIKRFENNMIKTKGVTRISSTKEGQIKMLANRKISGTYTFSNGAEKTYTGKYELKALEFMDLVLHLDPNDIMSPGPVLEYQYKGKTHVYITDFYYQPYNLIIEVKDGGDNPNNRSMPEYREKQKLKEDFIIKHTNYNYLRLTNNDMKQMISVFLDLKYQMNENTGERVIHVNESDDIYNEFMGMVAYAPVIGMKQNSQCVYIKNYMMNNVFSGTNPNKWLFAVSDNYKFDNILKISESGILESTTELESYKNGCMFDNRIIVVPSTKYKDLVSNIGKPITESELYEIIFGHKMYTKDQILAEHVKVLPDYDTYCKILGSVTENFITKNAIVSFNESNTNYFTGKMLVSSSSGNLMSESFGIDNEIIKEVLDYLEKSHG